MNYQFTFLFLALFMQSCSNQNERSGEEIAKKYCTSCHLFPKPDLLDKQTWKDGVLPIMGEKLGISYYDGKYATAFEKDAGKQREESAIGFANWMKLINYYTSNAPAKLPPQNRGPVNKYSYRFSVMVPTLAHEKPSCTYIKIDPGNEVIYLGSANDSSFSVYDKRLELIVKQRLGKTPVHLDFNENLSLPGDRSGVLTNIGSFYPNHYKTGTIQPFYIYNNRTLELKTSISEFLPRPVQTISIPVNEHFKDYLICGFGHETGGLYYLHKSSDTTIYEKEILSEIPGAVCAYIEDYNKDNLPDLMVLFAQGNEGIFLFTNNGKGGFNSREILRFPPVYGSTYFEMQDMNSDGLKDIIYTCGDNYDYSRVLKNYHGVYIFLNKGDNRFSQEYFFPVNGCYKAIGRDFDKDGDVDIAAISFFPDSLQLQESFVYLENKGTLKFSPTTIPQFGRSRWITMDAGDIDADGDDDIVIGNLVLKTNITSPSLKKKVEYPPFLLLLNKTPQVK